MKRIVITGLGVASPIGITLKNFYDSLLQGNCQKERESKAYSQHGDQFDSIRISKEDCAAMSGQIPKAFSFRPGLTFNIYATMKAIKDSKLPENLIKGESIPCYVGNSEGETSLLERYVEDPKNTNNNGFCGYDIAHETLKFLQSSGPAISFHNTCASSHIAMRAGLDYIKYGNSKIALVGACDPFSLKIQSGFTSLNALSDSGCRPFDRDRKGIVISEGAVTFVLEEREHAIARGAEIYAEILGIGISNDAFHLTSPSKEGIELAIRRCMKEASVGADDIDTVFAHATGTPANDKTEASVFNSIFSTGHKPAICAIKSTLGHMMSAAGAANTLAGCLSYKYRLLPPSKTTQHLDADVNVVRENPLRHYPNIILSNAFGFGGNNAVVLLARHAP